MPKVIKYPTKISPRNYSKSKIKSNVLEEKSAIIPQ